VACPAPGSERELAGLLATIASKPLDMSRPLWESWIVEGLDSGQIAVIAKVHHALADGVAIAQMFEAFCTTEPIPFDEMPPPANIPRATLPSKPALLRLAAKDVASVLVTMPDAVRTAFRVQTARRRRPDELAPAAMSEMRPIFLNHRLSRHRGYAYAAFPLADVKTIKNTFAVSINDVYLAVCAGAIQRLLSERGELPDSPLVAAVPMSVRTPEEANTYGNRVGVMKVRLPTNVKDPVARLKAAKAEADIGKGDFQLAAGARADEIMELIPPVLQKLMLRALQRANPKLLTGNVALSNVPGPREPLYFGDVKIDGIYGVGPLQLSMALNITAWSYVDELQVSVLCDTLSIPDPWPLVALLRDSFDELLEAATRAGKVNING
jgi:diacylglycerol O-acyltransferase / wax synthase